MKVKDYILCIYWFVKFLAVTGKSVRMNKGQRFFPFSEIYCNVEYVLNWQHNEVS